jgi:hypothetical protein
MNFKVSVQGVERAGTYTVDSEKNYPDWGLKQAGPNHLRQEGQYFDHQRNWRVKSYSRVDITKADFINSPFIIWLKMMWSMWNPIKLR